LTRTMAITSPPVLDARVQEFMRRPYVMEVVWDDDYWAARFPELPGLVAVSESWEDLQHKIDDAKWSYFEAALEANLPIPEPGEPIEDVSGRVLLRLPKGLHRQAMRLARREGVSVNTLLVTAIAKEVGREETHR